MLPLCSPCAPRAQLEQQLQLEREACASELSLRQQAETLSVKAQQAATKAQQEASDATQSAAVAKAALDASTAELGTRRRRRRRRVGL